MGIGAVALDLEGVYFEEGALRFKQLLMGYGHSERAVRQAYLHHPLMRKFKKGLVDSDRFWEHIITTLNLRETKESLLERMDSLYQENTPLVEWSQERRREGIIIAACSNTYSDRIEMLERKAQREGKRFLENFDTTAFSYDPDIRILKPDPHIFEVLSRRIGLPPGQIFLVDDSPENIHVARSLGYRAALYRSVEQVVELYGRSG